MIRAILPVLFFFTTLIITAGASAEALLVNDGHTVENILTAHIGKQVSIRTSSGEETSGTVVSVGKHVTHLGELTGKEFYDAVIVNRNIEAVIIRTK